MSLFVVTGIVRKNPVLAARVCKFARCCGLSFGQAIVALLESVVEVEKLGYFGVGLDKVPSPVI